MSSSFTNSPGKENAYSFGYLFVTSTLVGLFIFMPVLASSRISFSVSSSISKVITISGYSLDGEDEPLPF